MPARARKILLPLIALLALALALVAVLDRPATRSPGSPVVSGRAGSGSAGEGSADAAATSSSGFDGAALPANTPPHDFTLTDQAGSPVSLSSFSGHVTILAFLYSTCGPTCIVLADQVRGALDELPRSIPVLFVSADPAADSPAHIARFLAQVSLTGRVLYLSGSQASLQPLWRTYRVAPAAAGRAAFVRSAAVLLLDRSGRERDIFGLEQLTPEALAHDVRKLAQAGDEARG